MLKIWNGDSSNFFSWQEYYAVSEYTAIALLNSGYPDKAISLIKKISPYAFHFYYSKIAYVEPLFYSTKELLIFAHYFKGDYLQAEILANQLITDTQKLAIPNYQNRAWSIKAIIEFAQEKYDQGTRSQEQAIQELEGKEGNVTLKAVSMYNLWAMYRVLNNEKKANETMQILNILLEKTDSPIKPHIKDFIKLNKELYSNSTSNHFSTSVI